MSIRPQASKKVFLALSVGATVVCYLATVAGFLKLVGSEAAMLTMIVSGISAMAAAIAYVITSTRSLMHHSG